MGLAVVKELIPAVAAVESSLMWQDIGGVQTLVPITDGGTPVEITYVFGPSELIDKMIADRDQSLRYPLIAVVQPIRERYEGGYLKATFPKISFATLTKNTDKPEKRYLVTFEPIIYPLVDEFLKQVCRLLTTVIKEPKSLTYSAADVPGTIASLESYKDSDIVDSRQILDLELTFIQNTC